MESTAVEAECSPQLVALRDLRSQMHKDMATQQQLFSSTTMPAQDPSRGQPTQGLGCTPLPTSSGQYSPSTVVIEPNADPWSTPKKQSLDSIGIEMDMSMDMGMSPLPDETTSATKGDA